MTPIDKLREAGLLPDEVRMAAREVDGQQCEDTVIAALNALATVAWEQHEQLEEARSAMPDGDYWSGVLHRKNVEWMKDVQRANDAEKQLAAEQARADHAEVMDKSHYAGFTNQKARADKLQEDRPYLLTQIEALAKRAAAEKAKREQAEAMLREALTLDEWLADLARRAGGTT